MLTARLALYQHQPEVSLKLLGALLPEARAAGRNHHLLQITLLMAQAYAISKQTTMAHQYLLEALELGYAGGYLRSFLDEGERLIPLLHALLPDLPSEPLASYAQRILRYTMQKSPVRTRNATDLTILVNQLTAQERRVLRFLASGCSVPEIARELVVSVNTIRTQVQSIYRKLNVHDRDAAREIARQLHLG